MAYLEKIKALRPARLQEIERYLLIINDLAGVKARAVIRPSAGGAGASELVLVTERHLVSGSATIENYGSQYVGPWQALVEANLNSPLGYGEKFSLRFLGAKPLNELLYVQAAAAIPLTSDGLTLGLSALNAKSEPGFLLERLDVEARTRGWDVTLGYPLIRSRASNLTLQGGYRHRRVVTSIAAIDADPYSATEARSAFANVTYDFLDPWGGTSLVGLTFTHGQADVFDSSNPAAPPADRFEKLSGEFVRLQPVTEWLALVTAAEWAFSNDVLATVERFSVGGKNFGRGYDPAELSGDRGIAAKGELRYSGTTSFPFLQSYVLYGFYDFGVVWKNDVQTEERQTLASAGVGGQVLLTEWLSARVEVAKPLTRVPARDLVESADERKDPQFFFSLTARF